MGKQMKQEVVQSRKRILKSSDFVFGGEPAVWQCGSRIITMTESLKEVERTQRKKN